MTRVTEVEIQQDAEVLERGNTGNKIDRFAPDPRELIRLTPELAAYIIREISKGRSLISICRENGVPHETTFLKQCQNDPEMAEAYLAAKRTRAHLRVEEVEEIAQKLDPECSSKNEAYVTDIKAKNYVRLAEIGDPSSFSPKMQHSITGNLVNITLDLSSPQQSRQIIDTEAQQVTETPKLDKPQSGLSEEKEEGGGGS